MIQQLREYFKNKRITPLSLQKYLKLHDFIKIELQLIYQDYKNRFQFYYFVKFLILNTLDKCCICCGKPLSQNQINSNRTEYCSLSCVAKSEKIKLKKQKTIVQNYGSLQNFQKQNLKKRKQTNIEKYGFQFGVQSEVIKAKIRETNLKHCGYETNLKSEETKNKIKRTNIQRYGVDNVSKSQLVKNKLKKINVQKYGVDNLFSSFEIQNKCRKSFLKNNFKKNLEKWKDYVIPLFDVDDYCGQKKKYFWKCIKCGNQWQQHLYTTNHVEGLLYLPRCLNCYPYVNGFSKLEKQLVDYLKTICRFKIIESEKNIISPYQLDIYIPDKKLGIEFDGLVWHSNKFKKDDFNLLHKTQLCQNLGIKLIHVFEDQWIFKRQFVQKMIKLNFQTVFDLFEYAEFKENNKYVFDRRYFSKFDFNNYQIEYIQPIKFYVKDNKRLEFDQESLPYIYDCGKIILKDVFV